MSICSLAYNKAHLNAITVTNISNSFAYNMAVESTGIDMEKNYVTGTLCIEPRPSALNKTLPAFAAERGLQAY